MSGINISSLPGTDAGVSLINAVALPIALPPAPPKDGGNKRKESLHRLAEIRRNQGISLASVAKQLGVDVATARDMEQPDSDISLHDLYRWQRILDVPCAELLVDPEEYPHNPIRTRGQLVRLMKTARSIQEQSHEEQVRIFAGTLIEQLIEIMPELETVSSWPTIGQAREFKDYGQAIHRRFDSAVANVFDNDY